MKNYNLQPDEIVLFEGNCLADFDRQIVGKEHLKDGKVLLSNQSLVFERYKPAGFFRSEEYIQYEYGVDEIRNFQGEWQVKFKVDSEAVEIQLIGKRLYVKFTSLGEASRFYDALLKLLTGKSSIERGITKAGSFLYQAADSFFSGLTGSKSEKKKPQNTMSFEERVEKVRMLKGLLDEGAISAEEFEAKKKELLNL